MPEPGQVLLASCVIDRFGRIGAAPLLAGLAWLAGDPVEVDLVRGVVVIRAVRTGRGRIGSRGDIGIPSSVRDLSGLQPGQHVLLAALTDHGVLAIHSGLIAVENASPLSLDLPSHVEAREFLRPARCATHGGRARGGRRHHRPVRAAAPGPGHHRRPRRGPARPGPASR